MPDQPISVSISVGATQREFIVVGDPADAMFALQLGRTVSALLLELGSDVG